MGTNSRYIATVSPVYTQEAKSELHAAIQAEEIFWLDAQTVVLDSSLSFSACMSALWKTAPIFIRHIQPVHYEIEYAYDLEEMITLLTSLCSGSNEKPFLQIRTIGSFEGEYSVKDIYNALSDCITTNLQERHANTSIISLLLHEAHAYIGISRLHENGNPWIGGFRHYQMNDLILSRAEFKLQEAIELFDIQIPKNGIAIDLGAAPGGWTSVLRQSGLKVIAVDPAELDPRIAGDSGVTHLKMKADAALMSIPTADCVVNDMRMDPKLSAKLMNAAVGVLRARGWGIMTLKLPHDNVMAIIDETLTILSRQYQCINIRQLFHNRHEVTVYLIKK